MSESRFLWSITALIHRKFKEPGTEGRPWFGAIDMLAAHNVEGSTPITMPGCGHVVALSTIAFEFATGAAVYTMKDWITSSGAPMEAVDRAILERVVAGFPARDDLIKIVQPLLSRAVT
jgi:hypothetical protein